MFHSLSLRGNPKQSIFIFLNTNHGLPRRSTSSVDGNCKFLNSKYNKIGLLGLFCYTVVNFFLPLCLLLFMVFLPYLLLFLTKNPWVVALFFFLGLYVNDIK